MHRARSTIRQLGADRRCYCQPGRARRFATETATHSATFDGDRSMGNIEAIANGALCLIECLCANVNLEITIGLIGNCILRLHVVMIVTRLSETALDNGVCFVVIKRIQRAPGPSRKNYMRVKVFCLDRFRQ